MWGFRGGGRNNHQNDTSYEAISLPDPVLHIMLYAGGLIMSSSYQTSCLRRSSCDGS